MTHLCLTLVISIIAICSGEENSNLREENDLIVQTSKGSVLGLEFTSSWTNKTIFSFRGIPYASPPVGDLRFKPPVPPEKWSSTKDCTKDQPNCPQTPKVILFTNITVNTSEDCLYLNVYTPQIKPEEKLLPVMVWVHGGGFFEGSGSYFRYGPDFLVGEGVVVVTLNYRLGALGFLTLGTTDMPGNAGLKDQLLALKWVKEEIHQFGGDARNVTLFGESAGSVCVHLHYLSPLSKGLFHRVIGESGAGLASWACKDTGKYYAYKLAEALNCSTVDIDSVRKCLMEADADVIATAKNLVKPSNEDIVAGKTLVFTPTIDKNTSTEPFLPEFPKILIKQKQGSHVPFIMGINSDEGVLALGSEEKIRNITNNLDNFIPVEVRNASSKTKIHEMTERIKHFYFNNTSPVSLNVRSFVNLYTDTMFGYSTAVSARDYRSRADVYLYYFSFNGTFKEKIVEYAEKKYNFSGVAHAEELSYIFVREKVNQTADENSNEMKTWIVMTRLWTNFAKYGLPTVGKDRELQNVSWLPIGNITRYLHIDVDLTMEESDFLAPNVALWDSISLSGSSHLEVPGLLMTTVAILNITK